MTLCSSWIHDTFYTSSSFVFYEVRVYLGSISYSSVSSPILAIKRIRFCYDIYVD